MPQNGSQPTVAIVGAGPAGIAAATTLGQLGVRTIMIDEGQDPGGQYYKWLAAAPKTSRGDELDALAREAQQKAAQLRGLPVDLRRNTSAWGFFPPNKLATTCDDTADVLAPSAILLATGAIERTIAFPGWTLPGVMTAGGAQRLISHDGVLPGRRFVLAGTGPLLLAIAVEIAEAGGEVVAVVDCSARTQPIRGIRSAIQTVRQPGRLRQWMQYQRALRRYRIPWLYNHSVLRAHGEERVTSIDIAQIDEDWESVAGTERTIQADTLCLHYGFAASLELARIIGCNCTYAASNGGWHITTDQQMRTSVPAVYAAGQVAGIGGTDLAEATGTLAAVTIASDIGVIGRDHFAQRSAELHEEVKQARGFATLLNQSFAPGPNAGRLIEPDTILCRCEEVDAAQIDRAVSAGARNLNEVKRHTRCGMGYCQGRICSQPVSLYLHHQHGIDPRDAGVFTPRAPIRPVSLSALASLPDDLESGGNH